MITFTVRLHTFLRTVGVGLGIAALLAATAMAPPARAATTYTADFWKFTPGTALPAFPATAPVYSRTYTNIDLNWGAFSPADPVGTDNFLGRFTKTDTFAAGVYRFTVRADDGVRVFIDGTKILDRWFDQTAPTISLDRYVAAGQHTVKVEYYERTGTARVHFSYKPVADAGRGMWVWDRTNATDAAKRQQLLNFAAARNIDRLYFQSQYLLDNNQASLTALITEASTRGIEVELLFGNADWTYTSNHAEALRLLNLAKQYASDVTVKPAGVHYDVEPHTLAEWKNNPASRPSLAGQYIDLLETLRSNKGTLRLSADFAIGYKDVLLTRGTTTKELTKWVLDKVDRGYVMSYRDFATGTNSIIDHATFPVQYGANLGKPVGVSVETSCAASAEEGERVSFCEEGSAAMEQELAIVANHFRTSGGFAGLSIHDYKNYTILAP